MLGRRVGGAETGDAVGFPMLTLGASVDRNRGAKKGGSGSLEMGTCSGMSGVDGMPVSVGASATVADGEAVGAKNGTNSGGIGTLNGGLGDGTIGTRKTCFERFPFVDIFSIPFPYISPFSFFFFFLLSENDPWICFSFPDFTLPFPLPLPLPYCRL